MQWASIFVHLARPNIDKDSLKTYFRTMQVPTIYNISFNELKSNHVLLGDDMSWESGIQLQSSGPPKDMVENRALRCGIKTN